MAIVPINNASVLLGGVDISGLTNQLTLEQMVETKDSTTFTTNGWRTHVGVLKDASWNFAGFRANTTEPDAILYNPSSADPGIVLGGTVNASVPVVATITNPLAQSDVAFGMRCIRQNITAGAQLGELAAYSLALKGDSPTVRGTILGVASGVSATANIAGVQYGAVASGKKIYASLHVLSISAGDTLDVLVQSDDDVGFGSATTRITFTQVTDATTHAAQWATPVAGPITDDWWRVRYTITGTSPSFDFVVFFAIQ